MRARSEALPQTVAVGSAWRPTLQESAPFYGAKPNPYVKYMILGNLLIYCYVVYHVIAHSAEPGQTPQRPPKGRCTVARHAVFSSRDTEDLQPFGCVTARWPRGTLFPCPDGREE